MTTRSNPIGPIGLFMDAANLADELRKLCRPVKDGGAADYAWPIDDNPEDGNLPDLAVPVSAITALLDRMVPVRVVAVDEVHRFTAGGVGSGKSGNFVEMMRRLAVMGRSGAMPEINKPRALPGDQI